MPLDKYKLKLNEQNLSRFLNNLIFSILGFSDTKYKFNGEVLKYLQLWYLTWPWWGPKPWTPYCCPSWKPPICWNDAGIWLKLPWKTMARLDGNIKLWLATLICVNIQRSPFQTITSKIYHQYYLFITVWNCLEFLKIQQVEGFLYQFENLFYLLCLK